MIASLTQLTDAAELQSNQLKSLPPEIANLSQLTLAATSETTSCTALPPEIASLSQLMEHSGLQDTQLSLPRCRPEIVQLRELGGTLYLQGNEALRIAS